MKFGVSASGIDSHRLAEFAVRAEELGYESLWMPEHIVLPPVMTSTVPHAPAQAQAAMVGAGFLPMLDPFSVLCHFAAVTSKIRLGTSVALLALRDPFLAARCVSTLDILSAGRATVGVGAGWAAEEFELMGVDWNTRGTRLDELMQVLKLLFTEPTPQFHGAVFDFPPVAFEPKPTQQPGPPILVGGNSTPALRRAARFGDGWIGVALDPEAIAEHIRRLHGYRAEFGRTGPFDLSLRVEAELTPETVDRFAAAGVQRLIFRGLQMEYRASTDQAFEHIEATARRLALGV